LSEVKIKLKTVNKFLTLFNECRDKKRLLTVQEIATTINCSKGHSYNYLRALEKLLSSIIG
jgi:MarR-like DNA-binding transcriptional regulator SgrR of sgrS sRNA